MTAPRARILRPAGLRAFDSHGGLYPVPADAVGVLCPHPADRDGWSLIAVDRDDNLPLLIPVEHDQSYWETVT